MLFWQLYNQYLDDNADAQTESFFLDELTP